MQARPKYRFAKSQQPYEVGSFDDPHFTQGETEANRSGVACPRLHLYWESGILGPGVHTCPLRPLHLTPGDPRAQGRVPLAFARFSFTALGFLALSWAAAPRPVTIVPAFPSPQAHLESSTSRCCRAPRIPSARSARLKGSRHLPSPGPARPWATTPRWCLVRVTATR